jgi:hypothetical protein
LKIGGNDHVILADANPYREVVLRNPAPPAVRLQIVDAIREDLETHEFATARIIRPRHLIDRASLRGGPITVVSPFGPPADLRSVCLVLLVEALPKPAPVGDQRGIDRLGLLRDREPAGGRDRRFGHGRHLRWTVTLKPISSEMVAGVR